MQHQPTPLVGVTAIPAIGGAPDGDPRHTIPRPRSAAGALTGLAGIVVAFVATYLLRDWLQPPWLKALVVVAAVAAAMVLVDVGIYRNHRSESSGLADASLRPLDTGRVFRKLIGFWLTIAILAAGYWLLPEYAGSTYAPFDQAAIACLPGLIVLSPLYISFVDRRQYDPEDAYAQLGSLILGGERPQDWSPLRTHALGWLVKGFFLPLMFGFVTHDLSTMWSQPFLPSSLNFEIVFSRLIDLFYFVDVLLATVAYTLTFRLLDTHIRSVEPSVGGWVICLICYPPFIKGVGDTYLLYDQDHVEWGQLLSPLPWLYVAWGSAILALVFVYAWSTAAFGLRFSNLTNRGIITSGPYRWLKHPAYVSKNLSWWMISVPFVASAGWSAALQACLLLGGVNLIYFLRARTEERHLMRDPAYREYAAFIAARGLVPTLRRLLRPVRVSTRAPA